MLRSLDGFTVGLTADRRAEEQSELLTRRGAKVLHGPSIRTIPLDDDDRLAIAIHAVIDDPPDIAVLITGVGTRGWFAAAEGLGLYEQLRAALGRARVLARGPKAAGAALSAGLDVAWQAPSETGAEVFAHVAEEDVAGSRIAVQRDGGATPILADQLRGLGASVVDVPVYRWTMPDDPEPALRLIEAACERRLDALTFTSSPALDNLFGLAATAGMSERLSEAISSGAGVRVACVGPVCAATARRHGVEEPLEPQRARLGAMVQTLVRAFEDRGVKFRLGGVDVQVQGSKALIGDRTVALSPRERDVLDVLGRSPGRIVAKADLLNALWGGGDPHTVEVTVARLRRRLGTSGVALRTVPRRGYVLDVSG